MVASNIERNRCSRRSTAKQTSEKQGFVSGHRFSDAASAADLDAPSGAAHPKPSRSSALSSAAINLATLLIVIFTASSCLFAQTHTTVRHHKEAIDDTPPEIAQAETAIQKNDFASAETLLKNALDKDPDNKQPWAYQSWFDLGFVLNRLNRTDESIAAYRKSVAAKPDVFESNLNLGLMLDRAHNPDAEQFLLAATTLKPTAHVEEGQARAWLALAHLLENKKPNEALAAYVKAEELTPKDPEPHLSAGQLLERQKEFSDAEAEYKQVLTLDPHSIDAVVGLTNIYMKSNRLSEAEPLLRRLAAARPNEAIIHLQLGRILVAENKKDDAIAELQTTLKIAPSDADAQREIADLYASTGKNDLAETAYRALLTTHANDPELHRSLGQALLREKKFPEAQQEFLTALRLKRDWPDIYVDLAFAANENKNYELTVRALNGRAMLNAEMPPMCFFLRASAYDHLRDNKNAALDYHHFLDVARGKYPDQEWQATHRLIAIEPKR
jgi:tetratricopeptide (TPR) repeat protein